MKHSGLICMLLVLTLSVGMFTAAGAETAVQGTFEVVDLETPPEFITERKLTDEEIPGDCSQSLDELKAMISTYGDFAAWVRIALFSRMDFYSFSTSNPDGQYTHGAEFSYSWLGSWFTPNMTASVAQYVLGDDYPGIGTVYVFLNTGGMEMKCANYIPADGGYYIVNPELFIGMDQDRLMNSCVLGNMVFVTDLAEIVPYCQEYLTSGRLIQVLAVDSADTVVMDPGDWCYIPQDMTHVTTVYYDDEAKYPPADSVLDFSTFNLPQQMETKSDIDAPTARTLANGTYEEAADKIRTIPDVLNYLYYSGYSQFGIDQSVEMHDGEWHYNYKPQVVFRRGKGNCGGTSGLIAGLLEGDYDEVGMINLRFPGDGHVINYIKDKDLYYVFDGISWVGCGFQGYGLVFSTGKTLEEAALSYGRMTDTRQMAAYINPKGGDCPVMFCGNASKLPANYVDLTILQETPGEGFTYILVEEDPEILEAIDIIRGVW